MHWKQPPSATEEVVYGDLSRPPNAATRALHLLFLACLSACNERKTGNQGEHRRGTVLRCRASRKHMHRRAVEAVIWGTALRSTSHDVSGDGSVTAKAGEGSNRVVLLVAIVRLEEPDAHAIPIPFTTLTFFNTEGCWARCARTPPADGGSITGSVDD